MVLILLMAAIVNTALAGFTVSYGHPTNAADRVQFGGSDATHASTPPMYRFRGEFAYDDSRRTVIGVKYLLTVACWFFEDNEADMAANMRAVRRILSTPGRTLKLEGMGTGFGTVTDIDNGPRPLGIECNPIGNLAWECIWTVEFTVTECTNTTVNQPLLLMAFNFDTTWQHDFEGICQRTMSGYAQIAVRRNAANIKLPLNVADQVRDAILVVCPPGFRQVTNTWRENDAKNRVDFVVVDEQLPGDPPPKDVILASGDFDFQSGDGAGGFAEADVTLSMSLKVAPGISPGLAGNVFLASVISKQAAMSASLVQGPDKGTVIPARIRIRNRKFDDSRVTDCSMTWKLTKCLNAMLTAAGIWKPVGPDGRFGEANIGDYPTWRASVESLWGNRGTAMLRSQPNDSVIIDLCSGVSQATIGTNSPESNAGLPPAVTSLTCPDVPKDGGWLFHDLQLRLYRTDRQTWHKLAKSYLPTESSANQTPSENDFFIPTSGPSFTQEPADLDVTEFHGYPDTLVLLNFRALRMHKKPAMPELRSVDGHNVVFVKSSSPAIVPAFNLFNCVVWYINGWNLYRVTGYIGSVRATGTQSLCEAPSMTQNY